LEVDRASSKASARKGLGARVPRAPSQPYRLRTWGLSGVREGEPPRRWARMSQGPKPIRTGPPRAVRVAATSSARPGLPT
jgi:hypothetical protein